MSPAVQPPILAPVPAPRPAQVIALPDRAKQLRARRAAALAAARDPQITGDLNDTADQAAAEIAANPKVMRAILRRLALGCYAQGRVDQIDEDASANAQADTLAKATVRQLDQIITERREGGDPA